ncbi:MAG: hypothetical protein P4M11_04015 [Candidatus Pacebacteria bacterium]|nr:hypothetical protein [Candidatus Paceibacterota bacterium]
MGKINHGLTSFNRFIINNFGDEFRQQCIDVLLDRKSACGIRLSSHNSCIRS